MPDAVTVRLQVTWATMMMAKARGAMRPSRLLLMAFVVIALGTVLATEEGVPLLSAVGRVFVLLFVVRFAVMAVSSALDRWARRYDGAMLTVATDGLTIAFADGEPERHEWDWVLAVKRDGEGHVLQTRDRGGRAWLFLSGAGLNAEQRSRLSALLASRGGGR